MKRMQQQLIQKDLEKKLVFLVGPRQVGKTWLSKQIAKDYKKHIYLNYDQVEDRTIISEQSWIESTELIIFDELHKMSDWKNYLKGVFDTKPKKLKILVTGSARLDTFRQFGDSLAGRFFVHRLLPFSLKELENTQHKNEIEKLIERGGFPEPFLTKEANDVKRWRNQYLDGLIRQDVLDFEKLHDFKTLSTLVELLRRRVGSPISYSTLAQDLSSSPTTIRKYIEILESLFVIFRVIPYSKNIARSLLKEPKIYFYDNGMVVGDEGAKYENLIAVSLLKHVWAKNDYEGNNLSLNYLKTKDGREVDFCITDFDGIHLIIEAKLSEKEISKHLYYFSEKYDLKAVQVVKNIRQERKEENIEVRKSINFLNELSL
jgi:predicted AAA+ superfamily ATPase